MSAYTTLPVIALQNTTKYYMDDEVKKYKEGDVIYYSEMSRIFEFLCQNR